MGRVMGKGVYISLLSDDLPNMSHLTLWYADEKTTEGVTLEKCIEVVESAQFHPIPAMLNGIGIWRTGHQFTAVHLVNSPMLGVYRTRIENVMRYHGLKTSMKYGFQPHVTVGSFKDTDFPVSVSEIPNQKIYFNRVSVNCRGEHYVIPIKEQDAYSIAN